MKLKSLLLCVLGVVFVSLQNSQATIVPEKTFEGKIIRSKDNQQTPTVKKIVNDEIKADEKSFEAVLGELKIGNKNLESLIPVISDTYKGIEAARLEDSVVFLRSKHSASNVIHRKKIREWDSDDIYDWALGIRSVRKDPTHKDRKLLDDNKFVTEAMAVIMQGIQEATGGMPRHVHVIAVLVWFLRPEETGRVLQVASRAERVTVCTMLATLLVLKGHKVEIIYRSMDRATHERKDSYDYFGMFDIGVSDTENYYEEEIDLTRGRRRKGDKLKIKEQEYKASLEQQRRLRREQTYADKKMQKPCYTAEVVYSDVHSLKMDLLQEFYETFGYVTQTRGAREFDSVIIDGFDSITIDAIKIPSIVSLPLKGMEYTNYFQIAGWLELERYKQTKVAEDETRKAGTKSEDEETRKKNEMVLVKHMEEYFRKLANDEAFSSGKDEKFPMPIPVSLRELVKMQIPNWARMIVRADTIVEGEDYVIETNKIGRKSVVPLSYATAGEMVALDQNVMWINGLHQFLQVKHGLRMTPEAIEVGFMYNLTFINKYATPLNVKGQVKKSARIYGIAETVGTTEAQSFLSGLYLVDFVTIPTLQNRNLAVEPVIPAVDRDKWLESIFGNVKEKVQKPDGKNRAVLIVCSNTSDATDIFNMLKTKEIKNVRNQNYTDIEEQANEGQVIIVTSNLLEQGSNIIPSKKVDEYGGLHVIVSFLPEDLRVQERAFGQTAKQGRKGTTQFILNKQELVRKYGSEKIEKILKLSDKNEVMKKLGELRDDAEKAVLTHLKEVELPKIETKAEIFDYIKGWMSDINIRGKLDWGGKQLYEYILEVWAIKLKELTEKIDAEQMTHDFAKKSDNKKWLAFLDSCKSDFYGPLLEYLKEKERNIRATAHTKVSASESRYKVYQHAIFIVDRANDHYRDLMKPVKSIEYTEAVKLDPKLAFPGNYFLAKAIVMEKAPDKVTTKYALTDWMLQIKKAKKHLNDAKYSIETNALAALKFFKEKVGENTQLQDQLNDKMFIFNALLKNIDENVTVLQEAVNENAQLKNKCKLPDGAAKKDTVPEKPIKLKANSTDLFGNEKMRFWSELRTFEQMGIALFYKFELVRAYRY